MPERGQEPGARVGQTLSHYRVTASLAAGGMGELYRATDMTLGREVALKLLPSAFASDPERLARFERATLEDGSSAHFLAMELVEGEDLAARLTRGAIPVDESIAIAKQITEGLEEAHEHGIVDRDLKPANIKLTPDGKVKVLDFGLAKAYADAAGGSSPDLSQSPTLAHAGRRRHLDAREPRRRKVSGCPPRFTEALDAESARPQYVEMMKASLKEAS